MSRRGEGSLFIGRLSKATRVRDVEDVFEPYGRMIRCEVKYGAEMAYGFVDFEDRRDAQDALKYENGRDICGSSIIVEWAKGSPRQSAPRGGGSVYDECYRCHRTGHFARDCMGDRYGSSRRRGGRYRSPSPRGRRSRSRSRDRRRRSRSRSQSRSRDRRRSYRSRSGSEDRKQKRSGSRSRSHSRSKSKSRSPASKSRSGSPTPANNIENGQRSRSGSPNE